MKRLITHDYNNKGGKKFSIYITITEVSTVNFIICLIKVFESPCWVICKTRYHTNIFYYFKRHRFLILMIVAK
jgi:hypothetical protein